MRYADVRLNKIYAINTRMKFQRQQNDCENWTLPKCYLFIKMNRMVIKLVLSLKSLLFLYLYLNYLYRCEMNLHTYGKTVWKTLLETNKNNKMWCVLTPWMFIFLIFYENIDSRLITRVNFKKRQFTVIRIER